MTLLTEVSEAVKIVLNEDIEHNTVMDLRIRAATDDDLDLADQPQPQPRSRSEIEVDEEWMKTTSIVEVLIYQRAKSKKGFEWSSVSGIRADEAFLEWLTDVLTPFDSPAYKNVLKSRQPINRFDVKDKYNIPITKLIQRPDVFGRANKTEQELFNVLLERSNKPDWFRIVGFPDANIWHVQIEIEEEGMGREKQLERDEEEPESVETLVEKYRKIVSNIASKKGEDEPVIELVLADYLSDNHGFPDDFDIEDADLEVAKKAVKIASAVKPEDLQLKEE